MQNVVEVHKHIEQEAASKAVQEVRNVGKMQVGQVVRQGDIYIHCVAATHAHGKESKSRQLAMGETNGSRHNAEAPASAFIGTTLPDYCARGTFLGPLVKSKKAFTITHPEHAHIHLDAGCYQITHQMDARTLERVRD